MERSGLALCMRDFVFENVDTILFPSESFNGLFRANLTTGSVDLIGIFPGEELYMECLYCSIHRYKDYVLFVPSNGKQFLVYDMKSDTFQCILSRKTSLKNYKYTASILVDKYVYVFGGWIPEILRIDMETFQVKYYDGWLDEVCKAGVKEMNPFFYKTVCKVNNSLFLVTGQSNTILELNMDNDTIHIYTVGKKEDIFKTLAWNGECFLLMDQARNIWRADIINNKLECLRKSNKVLNFFFPFSVSMEDGIWFVSNVDGNIIKVDHNNTIVSKHKIESCKHGKTEDAYIMVKKLEEKKLAFFSVLNNEFYLFDQGRGMEVYSFWWENALVKYYGEYSKDKCHAECEFGEGFGSRYENIKALLEYVKKNSGIDRRRNITNNGRRIHNLVVYGNQ